LGDEDLGDAELGDGELGDGELGDTELGDAGRMGGFQEAAAVSAGCGHSNGGRVHLL